jgi:hypothetical protein
MSMAQAWNAGCHGCGRSAGIGKAMNRADALERVERWKSGHRRILGCSHAAMWSVVSSWSNRSDQAIYIGAARGGDA